jgi:predicted O-methyltransferase YrrM
MSELKTETFLKSASAEHRVTLPVWTQIEEMVKDIPGWTPIDQLFALFNLVYFSPVQGDVLEVGSWCGRSSCVIALAAKLSGKGKVYCVDLFPEKDDWQQNADGSYSFKVKVAGENREGYQEQTVWKEPFERDIAPIYRDHGSVFGLFNRKLQKFGLTEYVHAFRGTSQDFFSSPVSRDLKFKLAFIDADHSYAAVTTDIELIKKSVVPGGWICFDDAFSHYDGVNRAIEDHVIQSQDFTLGQQLTRKFFVAKRL